MSLMKRCLLSLCNPNEGRNDVSETQSVDHSRRDVLKYAASASVLGFVGPVHISAATASPLKSAGVLTFGPDNILFVADIAGAKIHAFALRDRDLTSQTDVISGNFHNFEGRDHVTGLD